MKLMLQLKWIIFLAAIILIINSGKGSTGYLKDWIYRSHKHSVFMQLKNKLFLKNLDTINTYEPAP